MAGEINDGRIIKELIAINNTLVAINKTLTGIGESLAKIAITLTSPPPTPTDIRIEAGK